MNLLTLGSKLCLNHFVETYDPTIEDSYRKQVQIDNQSCMLEVLDTAGQEEYTALRDQWIRDGEGFVLVYSVSSRSSFTRIQKFHHQIQRVKESAAAGSPTYPGSPLSQTMGSTSGPAPVMLVGNKCDRVTEREVSTQEGTALAKQLNCDFVEASAKTCHNVEKAFYDVVRQLRRQRASLPATDSMKGGRPPDGYLSKERDPDRGNLDLRASQVALDADRNSSQSSTLKFRLFRPPPASVAQQGKELSLHHDHELDFGAQIRRDVVFFGDAEASAGESFASNSSSFAPKRHHRSCHSSFVTVTALHPSLFLERVDEG
nr:protein ras-2 [Quercus suber]